MAERNPAFDRWWDALTLKGDPLHRPNLVREAFDAGAAAVLAGARVAIDEGELRRLRRVEEAARETAATCLTRQAARRRSVAAGRDCGWCVLCKLRAALAAASIPAEVKPCPTCDGCGQVADTDDQEPWTAWANLPPGSDAAVRMGLVRPIPCPVCAAPAEKGRAPYELRKGGIGHNEVVPAIVVMTPDGLRIAEEGDGG